MASTHPFKFIGLEFMAVGCPNACRHCKDSGHPPYGALLSLDDVKWATEQFDGMADTVAVTNVWHEPTAHPECIALRRYWRERSADPPEAFEVLSTNGFGIARSDDPQSLLADMREIGICAMSFTLHGLEENHDWFVCREGAYQDIWRAATLGSEAAMDIHLNIFLNKRNIADCIPLVGKCDAFADSVGRDVGLELSIPSFIANSRLRAFETSLRPSLSDLVPMADVLRRFWPLPAEEYTESRWIEKILAQPKGESLCGFDLESTGRDDVCLAIDRDFDVFERAHNYNWEPIRHGSLEEDGIKAILDRVRAWCLPTFPDEATLARDFGDPSSMLIHRNVTNLVIKWMDLYLRRQS